MPWTADQLSSFGQSVAGNAVNAGIGIVGNAITGLINNAFYKRNLGLQVNAQKELIDYQNEYNTPSAQMQRLAEAGLNPNLVYGSQAPAGQSGNAAAPAGHSPAGGYTTADVIGGMLRLQQIKGVESQIALNEANAEKALADARFTNNQADRYNELVDVQISEANQRIQESASRIGLNESSVQVNVSKVLLNIAETAYRNGEIGLQEFKKQNLIAQTQLYRSDAALKRSQRNEVDQMTDNLKVQYANDQIDLAYNKIVKDPKYAERSREAKIMILERESKEAAAEAGIVGSAFIKWVEWSFDRLDQTSRIAKNLKL